MPMPRVKYPQEAIQFPRIYNTPPGRAHSNRKLFGFWKPQHAKPHVLVKII
jgi:hypothetical protein